MFWKKTMKNSRDMITTGIGLGIGSQALGEIGGTPAMHAQNAIGRVSKALKPVGTLTAAGMQMDALNYLKRKTRL